MSVTIVGASAGTGKTERLSRIVADAIGGVGQAPISVEGLVAVTYTKKAEAELRARIRTTLAKRGAYEEAQRLPLAYIGTVHGVCNRLLTEQALAAGLPPRVDVLPERAADQAAAEALEDALTEAQHQELDALCLRLRPNYDARFIRHRWIPDAQDLIELARANQIAPSAIPQMAARSVALLRPHLGRRRDEGAALDEGLRRAIEWALGNLGDGSDTKTTASAIAELKDHQRTLQLFGELPWASWLKLGKLKAAVAFDDVVTRVHEAALAHREHPRFHDDVIRYLELVYLAVEQGMARYAAWKTERRYIDYTDMEEQTLRLLDDPQVKAELASRLQLLVVDEFQDTSPIQLALFLKLEALCKQTVWVGDRKQSIFAFRGADPMLMDAVVAEVSARGGSTKFLHENFRSRGSLVDFCSEAFARAFAPHGYEPKEVRATAHRKSDDARLAALPPLGIFHIEAKKAELDAEGVAEGLRRLLADPASTPVVDRATGETRDLRPGDIAVLTATNKDALLIAQALAERGIDAALPRRGLLDTPEGTFLQAALRLVADDRDTAARAQLDALDGWDGQSPDAWLDALIDHRRREVPPPTHGPVAQLLAAREQLLLLAPSEAVDELMGLLDLPSRAMAWPRPEERLANLEALRALAADYEAELEAAREPGSIVGFLHFLDAAQGSGLDDTGQDRRDPQHASGADAVQLCTYHRSKGLEWPVVILATLDVKSRTFGLPPDAAAMRLQRGGRSQHFSATPESDAPRFDPAAPLAGRWLRFWPWPYGEQKTADLIDAVAATPESQRLIQAEMRESLRLLYVGFTRARDHLIFAVRTKKTEVKPKRPKKGEPAPAAPKIEVSYNAGWLDTINDGQRPLLELPTGDEPIQSVRLAGTIETPARVYWIDPAAPVVSLPRNEQRRWFVRQEIGAPKPYLVQPSRAALDWPEVVPTSAPELSIHEIGDRIALSAGEHEMNEVGDTVHAIFAADDLDASREERIACAMRILTARGMTGVVRPEQVIERHDALLAWFKARHPDARIRREITISGTLEDPVRKVSGAIDLLLETSAAYIIVDHKTYPGLKLLEKAAEHVAQLAAYRALLERTGKAVVGVMLHFSVLGRVVEVGGAVGGLSAEVSYKA